MKTFVFHTLATAALIFGSAPALATRVDCRDNIEGSIAAFEPNSNFTGTIVLQNDPTYDDSVFQFAYPTFAFRMNPSVVVLAEKESEVQAAIAFAKQCGYTVSARSGGHSYLGMSSCDSSVNPCMQIDLAALNQSSVTDQGLVTVGPGIKLFELAAFLFDNGLHLPTGECSHIAIGGHMQTGGFGVW